MNLNVEPKDIIDAYSTPIVQQTSFWSKVKEKLGMDWNALLVYQQGQDVWFWLGGRKQWATFILQPWRVALSAQIQTTIIPGEKMVVIHPERHPWLESGAESHLFHPMNKPGIFRHHLSYYMTTMEIRSFTYRLLSRNINESQLPKYQRYKRNVGQHLYTTLIFNSLNG